MPPEPRQPPRRPAGPPRRGSTRAAGQRSDDRREATRPEPPLPDDTDPRDLDRGIQAGLRSLPETLADRVARHLVAAGRALDDDPAAAVAHARYARDLAPRLAVVREALGVAAYQAGDYATALSELRAVRRMTGDPTYLPLLADAERGLGRPHRALELARDPAARRLPPDVAVELAIVASGARRDLGEYDAAVVALHGPMLDREDFQPWTPRLWYAYAAALLDAGRPDEARRWFESVVAVDEDEETDAAQRVAELG